MNIIDNNGINYVIVNNIYPKENFLVTPDVKEEFEVEHDKLPWNIKPLSDKEWFDEAAYLVNYQDVLNRRVERSFYNMSGFGDVSIIAALMTLKALSTGMLPTMTEDYIVITGDRGLTRQIRNQFNDADNEFDKKVRVIRPQDYNW